LAAGAPVEVSWDVAHGVVVPGEPDGSEDEGGGPSMIQDGRRRG
jgi:hypothetical protein